MRWKVRCWNIATSLLIWFERSKWKPEWFVIGMASWTFGCIHSSGCFAAFNLSGLNAVLNSVLTCCRIRTTLNFEVLMALFVISVLHCLATHNSTVNALYEKD